MSQETMQDELVSFAKQLLHKAGGEVEWQSPDEPGVALVPPAVAGRLRMSDESFALSARPGGNGLYVGLAGEFLDEAGEVLAAEVPRIGAFRIPERHLKGGDLKQLVDRSYAWDRVRVSLVGSAPTMVEYHTWWFFASLRSDDTWETRLSVTLNSASLAEVPPLDALNITDALTQAETGTAFADTYRQATAFAERQVVAASDDFQRRMDARLGRDQKRLHDYYGALAREAKGTKKRAGPQPDPEQAKSRTQAVQLELRRKLGELDERYSISAHLRPIILIRTEAPALAVELSVQRRRAVRKLTLYWNSQHKQFEPIACSRCGASTFFASFTDETVEPLCAACSAAPAK